MAVRRIGSLRMPDQPNAWSPAATAQPWNAAPNVIPGDVLSGAPDYGGQSIREARGPIITEAHMAAEEAPKTTKNVSQEPKKAVLKGKRPKMKAVLPPDACRVVEVPSKESSGRVAINLRIPGNVLEQYRDGGPGYQSRIVSVLELFLEEGGKFVEIS